MRITKFGKCKNRLGRWILLAMTCAFLCAQGFAMSEELTEEELARHILDITVSVSPCNLVESGETEVTLTAVNSSSFDAVNLAFSVGENAGAESLGRLPAGETKTYTRTHRVTDEELDAGSVLFVISHDDIWTEGETTLYVAEVPVSRSLPEPEAQFTRHFSQRVCHPGEEVLVTYRLINSGNVPLTGIYLRDEMGSFSANADQLSPGEEKLFTNRVVMTEQMRSEPVYGYGAGDLSFEGGLEEAIIRLIEPELQVSLKLREEQTEVGGVLTGTATLRAEGSRFTELSLYDDVHGSILADALELEDGQEAVVNCVWPVREPSDYRLRLEGRDEAGERITAYSETRRAETEGEFSFSDLEIAALALTDTISRKGTVRLEVELINRGSAAARDVTLQEETLGEIRTFAFVPAGETLVRYVDAYVEEDRSFAFSISWEDGMGVKKTLSCDPVSVRISAGGAEPMPASEADGYADLSPRQLSEKSLYLWMIGIGGAVLVILLVLLAVSHDRERRAKKLRREQQKKRVTNAGVEKGAKRGENDV